jgi:membrane protease YdiL (CAAX protease family)
MTSTGTQSGVEAALQPQVPPVSRAHRWIDLGLVLLMAFATSILGSIYVAFHTVSISMSGARLVFGSIDELWPLVLMFVLLKRQGRCLVDLGFSFHWTDLRKAGWLTVAAILAFAIAGLVMNKLCLLITSHPLKISDPTSYASISLWLVLPHLIVNGFHEEMIVRGYLMTELIAFRKSPLFAVIVSLGIQTSYHLYYGVPGAIIVGCGLSVFALYYAGARRLMPVVIAHIFVDFIVVLFKYS